MNTDNPLRRLPRWVALLRSWQAGRRNARRRAAAMHVIRLESRLAMSGAGLSTTAAPIVMLSARTNDSRSVTIDYRVDSANGLSQPLQFGVYRSSDPTFDAADALVETWTSATASLDDNGQAAGASGTHELTIPLADGLPIDLKRPYVLVVADPDSASATTNAAQTASFRKYTIGVVTHGALINKSWKNGPPWQLQTATLLKREGYDFVIPFNWVNQSSQPGKAAQQGLRLTNQILNAANQFPESSPVDVHYIAHSEGAVVNTQAIVAMEKLQTPELAAGFVVDTLLDPHAATNNVPGQASTSGGLIGAIAGEALRYYQRQADDPPTFIPSSVDRAQVFYQHNPASTHGGSYNLWGQVPVPNQSDRPIDYYNLSQAGAIHSGNYGVSLWYRNFVAPTLADQEPLIRTIRLQGQVDDVAPQPVIKSLGAMAKRRVGSWGANGTASTSGTVPGKTVSFSGTAAPGAEVRVYWGPAADLSAIGVAGVTTADANGRWNITGRELPRGTYRAVAMSFSRELATRPGLAIVPMAPLGGFTIERSSRA